MKTFMLLILVSLPSFAIELCEQQSSSFEIPPEISAVLDATSLLWWSVSSSQYEQAACKTHNVPEYDWWLANKSGDTKTDAAIKGYQFHDQSPELLSAFRDITKN